MDKVDVELNHEFKRVSGFYRDKAGIWLPKTIEFFLVCHNSTNKPGHGGLVKIDMSSMIDLGVQTKTFNF